MFKPTYTVNTDIAAGVMRAQQRVNAGYESYKEYNGHEISAGIMRAQQRINERLD